MQVTIGGAASATTYNVTCTDANTEYPQALGTDVKWITFQARTGADVRFAFVTGKVAAPTAPYNTLKANSSFSGPGPNGGTLYLASATAGTIVELIVWV